jgi:diacylglycerol kinase (ATP)
MILTHLINALMNSFNGIRLTWNTEMAFRLEVIVCAFLLPITFWIEAARVDKFFVVFSLGLMLMTELINTAIEKANDVLKKTNDPFIKFSKDAASASVFIALCLVGISLLNLIFM